jgi:hypothetical protein
MSLHGVLVGCKTAWQLLKKLNLQLPYDPAIPFLGIYCKELGVGLEQVFVHDVQSTRCDTPSQ